ncbi:hypothetical protein AADZ91_02240 [Colwelliaceae bacterium 6441]
MLLLVVIVALAFSFFFYCQALKSGLGRKRWAFAGLVFGPFIWPMFSMKKRMKVNRLFGFDYQILRA